MSNVNLQEILCCDIEHWPVKFGSVKGFSCKI